MPTPCVSVHPRPRGAEFLGSPRRFIPARAGNTRPRPRQCRCIARGSSPPARGRSIRGHPGSSPPARGTRHSNSDEGRFIPARAGNTTVRPVPVHRSTPRRRFIPARAGNTRSRGLFPPGSSPPARGTPQLRVTHYRTPGAVHPRPRGEHRSPVHPRPRGEHTQAAGSSPPARGTRTHSFHAPVPSPPARGTRILGEHTLVHDWTMDIDGSSPPARGNTHIAIRQRSRFAVHPRPAAPVHPRPRGARFIPARAGNTRGTGLDSVHPRPPHRFPARAVQPPRFIPARAGNMSMAQSTQAFQVGSYGHPARAGNTIPKVHPPARGTLFPQDIDSKGVAAHQRPHQLRSPDPGEEAMARSRRVAPRFQLVPRWAVAARIARA